MNKDEKDQSHSLKFPSMPNRVRVLPTGPIGSEFDPGRDCSLVQSETQSTLDELNLSALPHWGSQSVSVRSTNKSIVWNWKPRDGYEFPESNDDALQIIPELASPPARPPRGLRAPVGPSTVAFRPHRPPPMVGDHLFSSLNYPSSPADIAFSLPMERSNLTLLHESSIYEPSASMAPVSFTQKSEEQEKNSRVEDIQDEQESTEANCFCCCFTTFCLVMSIILLTASAILAIIHGAEVYRRKIATLDPDTFFYTLPDAISQGGPLAKEAILSQPSCELFIVEPCIPFLNYNMTVFPNFVGHNSSRELEKELSLFREVMDGECYALAAPILCSLLQPQCDPATQQKTYPPCRSYCEYFLHKCDSAIPEKIRPRINCYALSMEPCVPKPACSEELRVLKEDEKICNGIVDCEDRSDEKDCPTEPPLLNMTDSQSTSKWYGSREPFKR